MKKIPLLIVLMILLVSLVGLFTYSYQNPRLGFKYYEPSYLPPNTSIEAKRAAMVGDKVRVEQNFRTEDWVYSIRQYKSEQTIGDAKQDYDPKSVNPTCSLKTSPNNMKYRLCHWIEYERIDVQEIKFIKSGTFIDVKMPSSLDSPIGLQDIDKFVDSFEQKSTKGFPVLRSKF